jgi:hypothetical protein
VTIAPRRPDGRSGWSAALKIALALADKGDIADDSRSFHREREGPSSRRLQLGFREAALETCSLASAVLLKRQASNEARSPRQARPRRPAVSAQAPQFRRFVLRVIQMTGFFDTATDGSQHDAAIALARRNLGLEILAMVESGQPAQHPDGIPVLTLIQLLREEANPPPQEKKRDRRNDQYDRNRDLDGPTTDPTK